MALIDVIRHFLLWLKYRRAQIVNTREELAAALVSLPPRIVVEGDDALRAYAATLAEPGGAAGWFRAERRAESATQRYRMAPPVGRVRARRGGEARRAARVAQRPDDTVVAGAGIGAALLLEALSFAGHARLGAIGIMAQLVLAALALSAMGWLIWRWAGLGRPVVTGWRLESRVPGRLVLARMRMRAR
jgi:hypothetical protein